VPRITGRALIKGKAYDKRELSQNYFLSALKARYLVTALTGQTTRRHAGTTGDALSASRWNSNCPHYRAV